MSSKTALILIDPYNEFLHPDGKLYPAISDSLKKADSIAHLKAVLSNARAKGIPVFYCMHQQTDEHSYKDWTLMNKSLTRIRDNKAFRAGTFGTEYFQGLEPDLGKGDVVVSKHWLSRYGELKSAGVGVLLTETNSSFANTDLDYQLKQRGIRHLVVCGLIANTCLEATARYAYELGYEITMLSDATAGFSDEARKVAADMVWPLFANKVVTADEWISGLGS